jgi:lipopolysaccharide export system protein LptC
LKPKLYILGGLILAIAVGGLWLYGLQDEEKISVEPEPRTPDYTYEGILLTVVNPEGKMVYRIKAPMMAHFGDDNTIKVKSPDMLFYRDDAPPLEVRSERAWLSSGGEEIMLLGSVSIVRPEIEPTSTLTIKTRNLRVFPEKKSADTDETVLAFNDIYRIQGLGGSIDLDSGYFKIHQQARGVYVP